MSVIAVGVDPSAGAKEALRFALEVAQHAECPVVIVPPKADTD
jgi:hypothetical protein